MFQKILFVFIWIICTDVKETTSNFYEMLSVPAQTQPSAQHSVQISDIDQDIIELATMFDSCPLGYFRCNGTLQCVSQKLNCDGEPDCDNGVDEHDCDDESEFLMYNHGLRKRPIAQFDDIRSNVCFWNDAGLENDCRCLGQDLECTFKNLSHLPKYLPKDGILLLDLTGNNYTFLTDELLQQLPELKILVLQHCNIKEIKQTAFNTLGHLSIYAIYLDNNDITSLPKYMFPNGSKLEILALSLNDITNIDNEAFKYLISLEELDLKANRLSTLNQSIFKPLINLQKLFLNKNQIRIINHYSFPRLDRLLVLSMADNKIHQIEPGSFDFPNLEDLILSGNLLVSLKDDTFKGVGNLVGLNLKQNEIDYMSIHSFRNLTKLTSLNLGENKYDEIDDRLFRNLTNLNHIYLLSFQNCKAALNVRVCEPRGDGISSIKHLLDNRILRSSVWIMASVSVMGNFFVLLRRYYMHSNENDIHAHYSLYLCNLAASDLIMGFYLMIIATADIYFRGEYLLHERNWRHGYVCNLCGFLSTLSSQSTTFLLTLITWDRYISVTNPLHARLSNGIKALYHLCPLWIFAIVVSTAPMMNKTYFGNHFYGSNGVCLSLHIHDPYAKGWEYSAALFIVINSISLIFILISYIKMLKAIQYSTAAIRSTVTGRELIVTRRITLIIMTDCLCWMPIIGVKVSALLGTKVPPIVYAWLAVFILPINAALNPVLYTLTTSSLKNQFLKFSSTISWVISSERLSSNQTGNDSGGVQSISLGQVTTQNQCRKLLSNRY